MPAVPAASEMSTTWMLSSLRTLASSSFWMLRISSSTGDAETRTGSWLFVCTKSSLMAVTLARVAFRSTSLGRGGVRALCAFLRFSFPVLLNALNPVSTLGSTIE